MNPEQQEVYNKYLELIDSIQKREAVVSASLKAGNYIISARGNPYLVTKITPKQIKVKRLVCKRNRRSEGYITAKERLDFFEKDSFDKFGGNFYHTTRAEIYILARGFRIYLENKKEEREKAQIESIKLAAEFTQLENERLDRIIEKYGLTKDCECITHDDPCFIHMQRYQIGVSAKHMARIDRLSTYAFANNESRRLDDLANYLEMLERTYQN